jgi:hypothetical protein
MHIPRRQFHLASLLFALATTGCGAQSPANQPQNDFAIRHAATIKARIARFEAQSPRDRTDLITKTEYKGKPAYLFQSLCCDQYDYLYDVNGNLICAPSGGIAGGGDGRCEVEADTE